MNKLFALIFILMVSCLAWGKNRHHLIFVHGIGGTAQTFGVMPEALSLHMGQKHPDTEYTSKLFVYATGNPNYDTDDFAMQFSRFLKTVLGDMGPEDKFSLITHSQGGLVATIWLFHAYMGREGFYPEYVKNVDSIVTLGTPFWGSKLATILSDPGLVSMSLGTIGKSIVEKMGKRQLEEMALGSRTILNFRNNVIALGPENLSMLRGKFKSFSIAGMPKFFKHVENYLGVDSISLPHRALLFGGKHFESDLCVSIPSARFDSIYTLDEQTDLNPTGLQTRTFRSGSSPFMIVNTIHASPAADAYYDMSYVPTKCLLNPNCDHPTYKYVLNHMLGNKNPAYGPDVPVDDLGGLTVAFNLEFPEYIEAKDQNIKIRLIEKSKSRDFDIVLAAPTELKSDFTFFHPTKKNIYYKHLTGRLKYKESISASAYRARRDGIKVQFEISAPGFETRLVETMIQPTFSTYIKLKLSPTANQIRNQ